MKKLLTTLVVLLLCGSTFAATTEVFFTRGLNDENTHTRNWSDANNWSLGANLDYPSGEYTTTPLGYVSGVGANTDVIVLFARESSSNGRGTERNLSMILDSDNYKIAGLSFASFKWLQATTLDGSYLDSGVTKYHTLNFTGTNSQGFAIKNGSGSYNMILNCNLNYDSSTATQHMLIRANTDFDITVGVAGKTTITSSNSTYATKEVQFMAPSGGDIYINSQITGYNTATKSNFNIPIFMKGSLANDGKIIYQGSVTNNINISMREYTKVELNMSNGAYANGANQWFAMAVGSYVKQMTDAQLNPTTVFCMRRVSIDEASGTTAAAVNCGTFDMNGFNFAVKNLVAQMQFSGEANAYFEFTFDFGATGTGVEQTFSVSEGGIGVSGANPVNWSKSKIFFDNYEDGLDKILFASEVGSEISDRFVFLDADGNEREGTVKWRDYSGMYEYYLAPVSESATVAVILGAFALGMAIIHRRK